MATPVSLTPRQAQVARLVNDGYTLGQVAKHLRISRRTTEHHAAELRRKFSEASTRRAASRACAREARTERADPSVFH